MAVCIDNFIEHNPLMVTPETLLSNAISLLGKKQHGVPNCVLVVATGKLIGILTKSDVVRLVATGVNLATTTIDAVMTQPAIALKREQCQNIQSIWSFFQQHSLSYVPIVGDRQELLGVIDFHSLIKSLKPVEVEFNLGTSIANCDREDRKRIEPNKVNRSHIRQKEREYSLFFDTNPSILCIAGFDGYFKRVNPAFSEIMGFTQSELCTEPFIDFVHPEDRAATIAEVKSITAGKTTISFENRYRTKDGSYRWLLWTAKSYEQEQIICAAARDITERKQAEAAAREREKQFRMLTQKAPVGIFQTDALGNCLFVNSLWQKITGLSASEALGMGWTKALHPDDRQKVVDRWQDCTQAGVEFAMKYRFKTPNDRLFWVFGTAVPNYSNGEVIGYLGTVTDITAQQTTLLDLQQTEIQLKQERDFSDAVINTVGALVAVLDRQGAIIRFNHTCEQITGYTFAEIKGKQIWEFLIAPSEKKAARAVFERLLAGQVPNQYENYWIAKDGSHHLISWSNTALVDDRGKVEFIIATGIDVTEQRKMWNKLEHQYRQTKLLAEITRKIRMSIDLEQILQTAVTEVQHLLVCDRVLIMEIRANHTTHTALPISESILPDLPPMLGYELSDPLLVGQYLARYHQGKILAIDNLSTASISAEIEQLLEQFKIKAKLVVPILSQTKLEGLLVAHQCHNPREWQEHEIQLLNQLADQIGVALSQAQLLDRLEEMVAERTIELTTTNELLQAEISEHQQSEAALRENQQKLTDILDNADEAIISIDEREQIQIFNQGAEKIFGYQAREVIGKSLDILLPKAFRQIHNQHISQFGQSIEQSRTMTERRSNVYGLRKNGEEFPAEASIAKLQTREGMLFTVMLKDITERQQAEEKLQASQTLLAKAEKIAKIGSWEYNLASQKLTWSEELFKILGFTGSLSIPSRAEILQRIHPEDRLLVENTLSEGHNQGRPWQFNYRWILPSGTIKYLESRGEPTIDSQGKVLKVWGTIMDISERIQAEKSLQRSEEQLKLITDALPVLIAYIDKNQRYLYNNRTYETWFSKTRSSLLGLHIKELFGENNYQKMLPYIQTALSGKAVTFEIQPTNASGNSYWMNATYIPDFDAEGEVKGFFSMVDDITSRKEIEQMKSEFISVASHEMRTPLTAIHGVIKLLCAGRLGNLSPAGEEMVNMALRNSERLVRLIDDVLNLERMELGRDTIQKQKCDSADLIQQAVEIVRPMAQDNQIDIEINAKSIELWVDRDRVLQIFTNLLSNAIKFSAAGSKVWITSQQQNQNVLFTVKDRGRGIPQDKLETIFERFQQVDASDSRNKGGTGLGLAICRHIVEQHGGKIWAESSYGRGSNFFFTLPRS